MPATLSSIYNHRAVDHTLGTSGQPTVAQLGTIAEAGFNTVINLALHDDPRYSLPDAPGTLAHYIAAALTYHRASGLGKAQK